jgi:uroporphyrinogen-III decarboxylase
MATAQTDWAAMTAEERRAQRLDAWRNPPIEWVNPEAQAAYTARVDRIVAALTLEKTPDRVPVNVNAGMWPAVWAGLTPYEAMNDTPRALKAWTDFTTEFDPDFFVSPLMYTVPGAFFEALDYKLYSWPGHGVPKDSPYQYTEQEWMLDSDYDELIADPSGFMMRTYLPRTVGAFKGFANVPPFMDFIELPFVSGHMGAWGSPEMQESLQKLLEASRLVGEWAQQAFPTVGQMMAMGYPGYFAGGTKAPFDILGDTLRGTKGLILDMFRFPEKVLEACERLVPMAIDWALRRPMLATPVIFIPLHKGADGFMSDEQFKTFYWPTLRKLLLGLIEEGIIPFLFAEGRYGSRLETIMDLPKGKTVWLFDQTDMARAKETIGQVACIEGNVPLSLMHAGTPEEVAEYCKKLIDTAGKGGGFIMDIGAVADSGKAENLRAMIETTKGYGVYS